MQFSFRSEGIDEYAVNKFLSEVFPADKSSCGKICSLIKESASRRFDMKEEVLYSILIYTIHLFISTSINQMSGFQLQIRLS